MPPLELVADLLLRLVLPAALAAALLGGLAERFLDRRGWHFALASGVALALLAGNWLRRPLPYLPDDTGWPSLLPAAIAALLFSAATLTLARQRSVRIGLYAVAAALLAAVLLPSELRTIPWFAGLALLILAITVVIDLASQPTANDQRRYDAMPLVAAMVLCGGAAAVLIYSHSARLADAATLLSAALLGVASIAWMGRLDVRTLALPIATWVPGLMLSGYHNTFSDVPPASFALAAVAPLLLGVTLLPAVRLWPQGAQVAAQFVLPAIPVGFAIALAIRAEGWQVGY